MSRMSHFRRTLADRFILSNLQRAGMRSSNQGESIMTQCRCLEDAAAKLAVSPLTLRRWAKEGKIESVRLGRRLVFRESDLETFISTGTSKIRQRFKA